MSFRTTLDFLLDEWIGIESLLTRERFADHSRETFGSVFDTCERIAREKYAPFNRMVDTEERVAVPRRGDQGRLGHRRARRSAGQCDAVPASLRPHGAGVDVARRGAGDCLARR